MKRDFINQLFFKKIGFFLMEFKENIKQKNCFFFSKKKRRRKIETTRRVLIRLLKEFS